MRTGLLSLRAACLVAAGLLLQRTSATPIVVDEDLDADHNLEVREVTTVYTYITHTQTVNPVETTTTEFAYTVPVYPNTSTTVVSAGCTQYTYPDLKIAREEPTATTITSDVTVTVTETDVPACTRVVNGFISYLTYTTPYTFTSTYCTNTLVAYYAASTTISSTYTAHNTVTRATQTEVCVTTIYPPVSRTSAPPPPAYTPPPDPFLTTTLATKTLYTTSVVMFTESVDTLTIWETECDNPTLTFTSTYYTRTITPVSSEYVLRTTGCETSVDPCAQTVNARAVAEEGGENYVVRREGLGATATTTPITTPVVAERTFTVISMVGATVTATTTDTWTYSVCSLPTSA